MTIQDVINKIIAYHPPLGEREATTCDTVKIGDTSAECTGVVTAIYASVEIIKKAIEAGCNLIVVHEPSFYTHMDPFDWLEGNEVFEEKKQLCLDNGIVIFRDHDRIHSHRPDGIFYGMACELGWQDKAVFDWMAPPDRSNPVGRTFEFDGIPVLEIGKQLMEALNLKNLRIIGNRDTKVYRLAFGGHLFPGKNDIINAVDKEKIDCLIPLEMIDWEVPGYFKDAAALGMNKACLQIGHYNGEELGMKWAVNWIKELVEDKIPVIYICNEDLYDYI